MGSLECHAQESALRSNSVRGNPWKFHGHTDTLERPVSDQLENLWAVGGAPINVL